MYIFACLHKYTCTNVRYILYCDVFMAERNAYVQVVMWWIHQWLAIFQKFAMSLCPKNFHAPKMGTRGINWFTTRSMDLIGECLVCGCQVLIGYNPENNIWGSHFGKPIVGRCPQSSWLTILSHQPLICYHFNCVNQTHHQQSSHRKSWCAPITSALRVVIHLTGLNGCCDEHSISDGQPLQTIANFKVANRWTNCGGEIKWWNLLGSCTTRTFR